MQVRGDSSHQKLCFDSFEGICFRHVPNNIVSVDQCEGIAHSSSLLQPVRPSVSAPLKRRELTMLDWQHTLQLRLHRTHAQSWFAVNADVIVPAICLPSLAVKLASPVLAAAADECGDVAE